VNTPTSPAKSSVGVEIKRMRLYHHLPCPKTPGRNFAADRERSHNRIHGSQSLYAPLHVPVQRRAEAGPMSVPTDMQRDLLDKLASITETIEGQKATLSMLERERMQLQTTLRLSELSLLVQRWEEQ
jgi:hypothetical protein